MRADVIDFDIRDGKGRRVTLNGVTDGNWRAVAAVTPRDDQRAFVSPSAAHYLLLAMREGVWHSFAVCSDDDVVGHVMWGWDDEDRRYWIGGVMVDAAEQRNGVGRAAMIVLLRWLMEQPDCVAVRLSYQPANEVARRLYASLGFVELDIFDGDEVVAEITAERAAETLAST